ncbi:uncharacterized protein LOC123560271 [Mercenaria mercenaria]|uniref:uncharacterized protein LOC123560271 n=1 Tax=Mercenaria mercenaria TaxID=6596 RepID=UPI00234E6CEE|nr:uncharacterized protein LOC123560271 [Mercenaria mercenaria]
MDNKSANEYTDTWGLKGFCGRLSECLDLLGYSQEMILYRRETQKKLDEISNSKPYPAIYIATGSKAEGTGLYFESDIDRMYVAKGVTCIQEGFSYSRSNMFLLDKSSSSPGYTRLKLVHFYDTNSIISKYLVSEYKATYIANSFSMLPENFHMIDINGVRLSKKDKSGPSAPYGNPSIKYDFVSAFECICPDIIQEWVRRPRYNGWPDPRLIKHISSLEGHVVPVANKGSKFPETEWRICFTKAELLLMHSLTEFQIKLYILLKLISKSVLQPLCSEISSYVMKNIVFWTVETNPKEKFSQSFLIVRLIDCLIYLKDCLQSNNLRNYMIAHRNLFEGRVSECEREKLVKKIDELLSEKENIFQHCDKIRVAMVKLKESPQEFAMEAKKRDKIEKLVYNKNVTFRETYFPGLTAKALQDRLNASTVYTDYEKTLTELIVPDQIDIANRGQNLADVFTKRMSSILS